MSFLPWVLFWTCLVNDPNKWQLLFAWYWYLEGMCNISFPPPPLFLWFEGGLAWENQSFSFDWFLLIPIYIPWCLLALHLDYCHSCAFLLSFWWVTLTFFPTPTEPSYVGFLSSKAEIPHVTTEPNHTANHKAVPHNSLRMAVCLRNVNACIKSKSKDEFKHLGGTISGGFDFCFKCTGIRTVVTQTNKAYLVQIWICFSWIQPPHICVHTYAECTYMYKILSPPASYKN